MIIRDMVLEDFEKVSGLMKEVHAIHVENRPDLYIDMEEPYSEKQFEEDIKNETILSILAEEENQILGICFVSFREKTCMVKKRTAYMDALCVSKKYRKRGVGTRLFYYVQEEIKKMGAERLDLMVWGFNESAYNFYEKMDMHIQRYILEKELS